MKKVRCISPHGGAHHGIRADNNLPAPPGYKGRLVLEPHEGGYVDNAALSAAPIPVGSVLDAPDDFEPDGFHFELVTESPPKTAVPSPSGVTPAAAAGEGK
jgi:hypothetical protein